MEPQPAEAPQPGGIHQPQQRFPPGEALAMPWSSRPFEAEEDVLHLSCPLALRFSITSCSSPLANAFRLEGPRAMRHGTWRCLRSSRFRMP